MVSKTLSSISKVWGFISTVLLVLVSLFTDEIRKGITSAFGVSSEVFVFFAIITLLLFGIAASIGIVLINWHHERERSKGENITMPAPNQKGVGRLSKLRRNPIRKEKRVEFWTNMIILIIVGAITMVVDFSFGSVSLPQGEIFPFLLARYTMLGFGILIIALSVWFMTTELYAEWESRKQLIADRKSSYLNTMKSFDNSFQGLRKATQPETREIRLDDFENWLRVICNDFVWDNEVGNRITEVLKYIPDKLSDDSLVDHYVSWLKMIINGHSKHTAPMIKEKFLTELEKIYDSPKLVKTDHDVIYILIRLHEYDGEYLIRLVNDAANRWSDIRFIELASTIEEGFSGLSRRSQEEYRKFYDRLDEKMEVAERNKDEKAFSKLKTLRTIARRYLLTARKGMRQRVEET
jgi:hypothetical protein